MIVDTELNQRRALNLGSGRNYDPEAVNLDIAPGAANPDIIHDLNRLPWPFPDDRFDRIKMFDVLEHLDDTLAVMEELHRVCAPGGILEIVIPHFSCSNAFTDPTHRRYFSFFSFDYFTDGHRWNFYTGCRFEIVSRQLVFQPTLLNKLVWRLAKRWPERYEQRWAWMFPAWYIYAQLKAVK
jgi:SAM-dependent methyltransferase